jgi:ketosteroid isomerase-like protein
MPPESDASPNIELLRRFLKAYNARDVERLISYSDPSIELESAFAAVGGAVYHGHDGIRDWFRDVEEAWGGELRVEPKALFDLGDHTLGFYELRGRGQHSGAEVAMDLAHVARWRDGRCVYFKGYAHREDALRELGVSEDELDPIEP